MSIVDEIECLCDRYPEPYVIFRDPLFTGQRERCLALCDAIETRRLSLTFEAETRLDRLDIDLLDRLHAAGLGAVSFGVESLSAATLKKAGRRRSCASVPLGATGGNLRAASARGGMPTVRHDGLGARRVVSQACPPGATADDRLQPTR